MLNAEVVKLHMEDGVSSTGRSVVKLMAGQKPSGEFVFENVLTELVQGGHVRLLHTPGLVLGVAAGDVIDISIADGSYALVSRGGNLAVQIYGPPDVALSIEPEIRQLGGWHDGGVKNLTVFTVPASAGFGRLEAILDSLTASHSVEWYYGNVYGEDGVTSLRWWE